MNVCKKIILTENEIGSRVRQLAEQINIDFSGKRTVFIGILTGCLMFLSDLFRHIDIHDAVLDFMKISSYEDSIVSKGTVKILQDLEKDISGYHVIVVEDILDTGRTLHSLLKLLKTRNPAGISICTLLDKPERRIHPIKAAYTGFVIPDEFVIGYGLDYNQRYRNLPYIGVIRDDLI